MASHDELLPVIPKGRFKKIKISKTITLKILT